MAELSKKPSEEDARAWSINPAIIKAGWTKENVWMGHSFTEGRVVYEDGYYARKNNDLLIPDYVLLEKANTPIAIIEAKKQDEHLSTGIQQAIKYAKKLDVRFAYSSNGTGFLEYDIKKGKERELSLDEFPTLEELKKRIREEDPLLTPEVEKIIDTPYAFNRDRGPRYYQFVAINRTIEAIAKGRQRILLVMATGTGKTYTAFQIIHRLHASGAKKKILYLADRNVLIDQTMSRDFKPFSNFMVKIEGAKIDTAYEVYMALYHQLVGEEGTPDPFTQVPEDFFDLIVVDECHRGSARDDSAWRKVLEYFSSATQIGMTATPREDLDANNVTYFGKPIYSYTLEQGINDGFLAPYRVTNCFIDIDLKGYTPREDERDLYDREIDQRFYTQNDIGKNINFLKRRLLVANRITRMLYEIGRDTKTIVFCTDTDEAAAMRDLLTNMNSDRCQEDSRYVMRITHDDKEGKLELENFTKTSEKYPTIVTTSELLSTGVDTKMCGLIVIDRNIESPTMFWQIMGRGTRVVPKKKLHFEVLDFRNVTKIIGAPENLIGGGGSHKKGGSSVSGKREKFIVEGETYSIVDEQVSMYGEDGLLRRVVSYEDFAKEQILKHYASHEDFLKHWNEAKRKETVITELVNYDVLLEPLVENHEMLAKADALDVYCYVAYGKEPLTREERANRVKGSGFLDGYSTEAREVLKLLLESYVTFGICDLEDPATLEKPIFSEKIGMSYAIMDLFGGVEKFKQALRELEKGLYI